MSIVKQLVAKKLTAVGKLLILLCLVTNQALADFNNPRFFEYKSGEFSNQLITMSFGWFKTLSESEKIKYHSAIHHALLFSENGEKVVWYGAKASGMAVPVITFPNGSGYCRRIYVQATAYNVTKDMDATACFSHGNNTWTWVEK